MENYNRWAIALAKHFFGSHMSGKRTRLTVNREFLNEEFGFIGGVEGLITSVKSGPKWSLLNFENSLHEKALSTYRVWKTKPERRHPNYPSIPDDGPPYLPFLVLLCLAWTVDDKEVPLAGNSFYERLGLIFPDHGLDSIKLSQWKKLWESLEDWTEHQGGKRGVWKLERVGQVHVGIPCSQTILTPCKIRRLPWLFHVTGLSLLANRSTPTSKSVKAHLFQQESHTRSVLGNFLTGQISDDSEIGKGVIELLKEQLENPENRFYEEHQGVTGDEYDENNENIPRLPLRVALERSVAGERWHLRFCLLGENAPAGKNWSFTKKGTTSNGAFWIAHDHAGPVMATEEHVNPDRGFQYEIESEGEDGSTKVRFVIRKRGIRLFRNWVCQNFLFEEYDLPDTGGCYLLSHHTINTHLENWLKEFELSGGTYRSFPQEGLPDKLQLTYVDGLEKCTQELLSRFPEKTALTVKPSYLSFGGGSRIQGAGAERLYLAYDPPSVVLESRGEVSLNVEGAKLIESTAEATGGSNLPGNRLRTFEIDIEDEAPSVTFDVSDLESGEILEARTIGITQHQLDYYEREVAESIRFDRFGQATARSGLFGSAIDSLGDNNQEKLTESVQKQYISLDASFLAQSLSIANAINDKRWNLLESLSAIRRITGKEFRRRVERIVGEWHSFTWSDLRWLRSLGHVEVQRDKKGRIAYIYHVKSSAYRLPWQQGKLAYFAIGGCPTRLQLEKLEHNAKELDCKLHAFDRGSILLPPLLVIEGEEESSQLCLGDAGYACMSGEVWPVDSLSLARYAGSLEERCMDFFWQPGDAPKPESVFNPYYFRMLPPQQFACPYKLYSIPDSYSPQNKQHAIEKRPSINDLNETHKHVFLSDPSWGKWLTLARASRGIPDESDCPNAEFTPIPYDTERHELIVPASLRFPSLLSRALLMCSGTPPRTIRTCSYFSKKGSIFLPDDEISYEGTCYGYQLIPDKIAKLVCSKVFAWPVPVSPAKNST